MSDNSRELVRCAKCGNESQQLVIYSVNYSLGDKESNDKLVSHKQKCPYCNYEAISIDTISDNGKKNNGKLKREEIIRITDEFIKKLNNYDNFKVPNNLYLDYFNEIKKCFDKYLFEDDNRFVTYGRLDFLREELTQRLADEFLKHEDANWKEKWDNRLGAFIDLFDVIRGNAFFGPHQVPQGMDFKTVFSDNDQYYKDGYICKQEKELILNMMNEIQEFINNSLEEKDMGLFSKKNKYDVKPEENVPQFVYGIPDFMKEKLKKEADKKYDVKPEENVSQAVYGIPDFKMKELEKQNIPSFDFDKIQDKYDVKPEDNVPQFVYGTPDSMKNQTSVSYDNMSIRFRLDNGKKRYVMLFKNDKFGSFIIFANQDKLNETAMADAETLIPKREYDKFCNRLAEIIQDWDEKYEGDKNINWDIRFIMENEGSDIISGKGAVPSNWNKLVDLLSEYEILFKKKKKIDKEKKKISNDANKTFEEIVREDNVDQFWADTIINYFKNELKENDAVAKIIYKDLTKYNDIFNEFTKYLVQKSYDIPEAINVEGYTAKQIHELNPNFTATGVYTFLKYLKDKPEEAKAVIKKGFPNKDVIPPTIAKANSDLNDDEAEKRIKEIEDEVDQEMIKQGLLKIENGRKIPSFGSCHVRWGIEKKILKERFGIDWKTPAEKNPYIDYD